MKRSDLYSIFDNIIHLLLKDRRNRGNACDWHLDWPGSEIFIHLAGYTIGQVNFARIFLFLSVERKTSY